MAADFPTSLADFLSYTAASEKGVPFDVFQNIMDEILAVQTLLGAGSAPAAFTPTIISSGGGTPTYSIQVGRYCRALGRVFLSGRVTLATFGTLAAGNITIGGLPVASVNIANTHSPVVFTFWTGLVTAIVSATGLVAPNASVIDIYRLTAASTINNTLMTKADLSGTAEFIFSGHYPVT